MCEAIEDSGDLDKLGQGFTSADPLEKVDNGYGTIPRPTFVNKNLSTEYKADLVNLLKEYVDCFAWEYHEMPDLSRDLLSIVYKSRPVLDLISNRLGVSIPLCMTELKLRLIIYLMLDLFVLVGMMIGFLISCLLRKQIRGKSDCALILEILIKLLPKMNILYL